MNKTEACFFVFILVGPMFFIEPVNATGSGVFSLVKCYWGTTEPIEVSPGDVATLTVILKYEARSMLRNLEVNLSLPTGFEAVGGGNKTTVLYTGTVSQGSLVNLEFDIFIAPDVEKGNYTGDLEIYYLSNSPSPQDILKIPIEVSGKPNLVVRVIGDIVHEGKQHVLIEFRNKGDGAARNLKVTKIYSSNGYVELENGEFLGDLEPQHSLNLSLSLFVPTGMKGKILPLTVEATYLGPKNVVHLFSETLRVPVKSFISTPPLTLSLNSRELSIGKNSVVLLNLVNPSNHSVSEIKITLSSGNILKIFGPTILYVENLGPKESKQLETEIYVPSTASAPTASLVATITYFDEGSWQSESESYHLSLLLRGLIDMSLTDFAVIPSKPRSGSPFSITITVTNIGTSTAYAAYATPSLKDLPLKPFGPRSTYIGNIEVNLPTTFTINLQLESTSETRLTLPITLSYMDNLRTAHQVTFNIPITVELEESSNKQQLRQPQPFEGWEFALTAVAVVAAVMVFLWAKKWRKKE